MRAGAALMIYGALIVGVKAQAAGLNANFNLVPSSTASGGNITVEMQVTHNLSGTAQGVSPQIWVVSGGASANLLSGPNPISQDVPPSPASRSFTWIYQTTGCGNLQFTGLASGWDQAGGVSVTSNAANSVMAAVACTPSPTPTVSPTPYAGTPTTTPTPTDTPWIAYVTPVPPPAEGNAQIRGNLFHPAAGKPMELRFDAPFDGRVTISLVNRLGGRVRRIERDVAAGSHVELWDGRTDAGIFAAGGIYVALFQGKGLNKAVKFAVVR